MYPTWHH